MSNDLTKKHCIPCEGGVPAISDSDEDKFIKDLPEWELIREGAHRLKKKFKFKDFKQAMIFINKIADLAESERHHPDIYIFYNKVEIQLSSHAVKGLTESDFIMAAKIEEVK